jgi:hypothetical protein
MPQLLKRTGVVLIVAGMILGFAFRFVPDGEWTGTVFALALGTVLMMIAGAFLFWRGRQYAGQDHARSVLTDASPDVLYLRDFRTDPSTLGQVFSALLTPALLSGLATEEEQLAQALRPFGDLVAIGKPGEQLPTPGAARMYASHEEWRDVVSSQMSNARMVVIRAGSSEGVMWELKRAVQLVAPQRLLILVLQMKRDHYAYFRHAANAILGCSLPATPGTQFGRVSGFIAFAADWTPSFLPLHAPFWRRSGFRPLERLFRFALRPVYETWGVPWTQPPVSRLMMVLVACAGLFGLMMLAAVAGMMLPGSQERDFIADSPAAVPVKAEDPYLAASNRLAARIAQMPEMQQVLTTLNGAGAHAIGQELTRRGLRRLDDDVLIRRAAIMARIYEEADTATCAAMFREEPAPNLEAAMRRLSPEEIDAWFDLIFEAMSAELRRTSEPVRPPQQEIRSAFQDLIDTLSPEEADLLSVMVQAPREGTLEHACHAGRLLHRGVGNLPEETRATAARALVW